MLQSSSSDKASSITTACSTTGPLHVHAREGSCAALQDTRNGTTGSAHDPETSRAQQRTGSAESGGNVHKGSCVALEDEATNMKMSTSARNEDCHQQLRSHQLSAECFICLESQGLLLRGCACRGSAGFMHLSCLVTAAQVNAARWHTCPTCEQRWTGRLKLAIARAHYDLLTPDSAGGEGEVLQAAMDLTWALRESCQLDEALQLGQETLSTARRTSGDEHVTTLTAMGILASVYGAVGDHAAALPLETHVLTVRRRLLGNDHHATLTTVTNLGVTHLQLGSYAAALPLIHEALEGGRRANGPDHPETLTSIGNLGTLYSSIGSYDLALPLVEEALNGRRRVLGNLHPDTLHSVGGLGILLCKMGNHTSAANLLQEAVSGFAAVYGEAHPLSRRCRHEAEHNMKRLSQIQECPQTDTTQAERIS